MNRSDDPQEALALLVRKLRFRSPLSDEDAQAILALPHSRRLVEPSTYLVREGDPPVHCAVLLSGFAYRHKVTGDGARQIVALLIPGEAVDLQNLTLDVSDHNVQMLTRGEVAFIPRREFELLSRERPAVARALLVEILVEASIFREWVLNVGRRPSKARLAHVLCELGLRLEAQQLTGHYSYELPMTQEQLADALGLTPVHVNRVLKLLESEGLIKRSKRTVSFPDWERMRDVADFNQRYLHLEPQGAGPA